MNYFYNTVENRTVGLNNPGSVFYKAPWQPATQTQIDTYDLKKAKADKVIELKNDLENFREVGFTFQGVLTAPATFNLSENSARYADVKSSRRLGGINKSKFYDKGTLTITRIFHDFVDDTGFDAFVDAINEEEERIMEKYNEYRVEINEATTVPAVDAITIDFSV